MLNTVKWGRKMTVNSNIDKKRAWSFSKPFFVFKNQQKLQIQPLEQEQHFCH